FVDRSAMAKVIGQVIPGCRIIRVELARLFPLGNACLFIVSFVKEAAIGQASTHMVRMALEEIFVSFSNWGKALFNPGGQRSGRRNASGTKCFGLFYPLIRLLLSRVILFQEFLILAFDRVVGITSADRNPGWFGHPVGVGGQGACGDNDAQQD